MDDILEKPVISTSLPIFCFDVSILALLTKSTALFKDSELPNAVTTEASAPAAALIAVSSGFESAELSSPPAPVSAPAAEESSSPGSAPTAAPFDVPDMARQMLYGKLPRALFG